GPRPRVRHGWPPRSGRRGQSDWVNRAQRSSNSPAAPLSIASAARDNPASQAGSHSAELDSPAWATIAPAALRTTASRTGPVAPENTDRASAALNSASPPTNSDNSARGNPNPAGS